MQTRTLATDVGDVTIREWGRETAQADRLVLALHAMGPVSTGALYGCAVGPLIPTLLLLATEPGSTREQNEKAGHAFGAVVHQADVRLVQGATHSLVTDLREEFGRTVAEWLATLH